MFSAESLLESPYSEFYNEKNWSYLEELIIQETCKVISKPKRKKTANFLLFF